MRSRCALCLSKWESAFQLCHAIEDLRCSHPIFVLSVQLQIHYSGRPNRFLLHAFYVSWGAEPAARCDRDGFKVVAEAMLSKVNGLEAQIDWLSLHI